MKKILSGIAAVTAAAVISVNVSAEENVFISQYYSSCESITVYTTQDMSDDVTARIAGISCEAENLGSVYHNAEKYETVFLIDSSASMQDFSDEINSFLSECIDKKRENEYYSIGLFSSGNSPEYIVSEETDRYALEKSIDSISYDFKSTYIYDNLVNAIETLYSDDEAVYRRIVLITDGNENSARGITIDDVIGKLDSSPVPVFTVTLQTSDKSNIENLKNISRIARGTYAEDIRISDGGDAVKPASILSDSAQAVDCIRIVPDTSLLDGSVKALEISDGTLTAVSDIRLAMGDTVTENTETSAETAVISETLTEPEVTVTEAPADNTPKKSGSGRIIAIAAALAIAAACIIFVTVQLVKGKKKKTEEEAPAPLADNDETMIISGRSGQTEILIDDNNSAYRSVILRDSAESERTFEVQLSENGAVIGRSSDFCDIVINYDKSISRKHCRIFLKNGLVYIEDLSSGNKTYLNGSEVSSPAALGNTDEIKIGRTKLKVTLK